MSKAEVDLIVAQLAFLKERGWKSDDSGFVAKPGTEEYTWDLDHAVLCEKGPDRDKVTGFEALIERSKPVEENSCCYGMAIAGNQHSDDCDIYRLRSTLESLHGMIPDHAFDALDASVKTVEKRFA